MRYDPKKIESKWQRIWQKEGIYEPDLKRAKRPFYNLMMFPYPSAEGLHIGSVRTFTGIDLYGRFKRMQGYDVFEPIGLDGFGIHSENYALKVGKHPMQHAKDSEKNFYRQLGMIGNGFAWREKLETYDPEYYRWTQWIFTQMFEHGLAYRKKSPVNWCPSCKTVLADEQVLLARRSPARPAGGLGEGGAGECERCQSKVVKKDLEQWFFKITDYAERLLKNLGKIDWPEPIKIAQRNWIGKSEGALIRFPLKRQYDYVFLHAFRGSPAGDFWPWLKNELEKRGAKVYAPQLPNPDEPKIEEQVAFVLKNYNFDQNTVIVTHSLGGVVAMKLLPKLKSSIAGLVMVAPPLRTEFLDGKRRPALEKATDWKFDFAAIRNSAERIIVIQDAKDSVVPPSHPEEIAKGLGARLLKVIAPAPHFNCPKSEDVLYGALLYGESLKFDLPKIPGILSGGKYITVRLHPKNLRSGDLCELIDSTTGKKFALAEITGVEKKKMKDVPERGRGLQEFKDRPEFYKVLGVYYKMVVNDNTDAWLYYFRLVDEYIEVFTTRPDTLFGATYMVVAPEHPLIKNQESRIKNQVEVNDYIKKAKAKTDEERIAEGQPAFAKATAGKGKTGVELKGIKAINPANGEEIPVWVADYVLGGVGTGAIMAVPAHDDRDKEFALKYELPSKQVVAPYSVVIGTDAPRSDKDIFRFDAATAIVKHWKENNLFYVVAFTDTHHGLVGGHVESGESNEETALREVKEESGYTDIKDITPLFERAYSRGYKTRKQREELCRDSIYVVKLRSGKRVDITDRETKKGLWMTAEEILRLDSLVSHHKLYFEHFIQNKSYTMPGKLISSGEFDNLDSEKAKWEITRFVGGERKVQYRLRDWLISRQRYWGAPIPMVYCEKCKWQPVQENDLPVRLPYIKDFRPTGTDKSPLATVEKFYKVRCPKCRSWARRETDVSDTFLDSAWYYIGFLAKTANSKFEIRNSNFRSRAKRWLPVNMYIGGAEHAVLHLLYVRFLAMAFYDWGLTRFEEPFKKFRTHGLITKDGAKMSKSKGNVVNPDDYIKAYGSDAIRMYLAFLAPLTQGGDFRDDGIRGITRFLERAWKFANYKLQITNYKQNSNSKSQKILHRTIKKVTEDIESLQYNTAISALMVLLKEFEENVNVVSREDLKIFLKLLAPFAPHMTEELWHSFATSYKLQATSIHRESWPKYDPRVLKEETFELVVQVNGKVRGRATLPVGVVEEEAKKAALAESSVKKYIPGRLRKVIFVPDKLINFVM